MLVAVQNLCLSLILGGAEAELCFDDAYFAPFFVGANKGGVLVEGLVFVLIGTFGSGLKLLEPLAVKAVIGAAVF